jgi:class II lanthipeptide synthase
LLCRRYLDDPLLQKEAEAALRTALTKGFGSNHSLCHGDLGNLELLLQVAREFPGSVWGFELDRLVARTFHSITRDGYGLLRCAEPNRVPSILSLAPPA